MRVKTLALVGFLLLSCSVARSTSDGDPGSRGHSTITHPADVQRKNIITYASTLVGTPYVYGGMSPKEGFDCSGFTAYVLRNFGKTLPHSSGAQASQGKTIAIADAQPGDLLFFGNGHHVDHVAMVVQSNKKHLEIIHSSSSHGVIIEDIHASEYWLKKIMFAVDMASF